MIVGREITVVERRVAYMVQCRENSGMSSHQKAGLAPVHAGEFHPAVARDPSVLVRTHRIARLGAGGRAATPFATGWGATLLTLRGERIFMGDDSFGRSLLIPIDNRFLEYGRADVEIGWVRERLPSSIVLALIWPQSAAYRAGRDVPSGKIEHLIDSTGEFGRFVRSAGHALGLLVDPKTFTFELVSAEHSIFAVGQRAKGTDHTLDLGDVHH